MNPIKAKNKFRIDEQTNGLVTIRYNWNLNRVKKGMLARAKVGSTKKLMKYDMTTEFSTYLVTSGVSRT
jgi:hypothetical protein